MLTQVLREIQTTQGTLRLDELATRLDMQPSALKGMIDFWVSKGRLKLEDGQTGDVACGSSCGASCAAASACPFVAKMPVMYSLNSQKKQNLIEIS